MDKAPMACDYGYCVMGAQRRLGREGSLEMSLDVYLTIEELQSQTGSGIYIRENGAQKEITREEWDSRFPNREPVVAKASPSCEVYTANVTHNLGRMAREAGVYQHLWRPDEIEIKKAMELIEPLKAGLALLRSDPERFMVFNPSNGWGDYEGLVGFVENYLAACEQYPNAEVSVWR